MIIFYIVISVLIIVILILLWKLLIPKGVLEIDYSNPKKPRWLFLMTVEDPTEYVMHHKYIVMKIKNVTDYVKLSESANISSANMEKEANNEERDA